MANPQTTQRQKKKSRRKYAKPVIWTREELIFTLNNMHKGVTWITKSFVGERHARYAIVMILWRVKNRKGLSKLLSEVMTELGI